MRVGCAEVTSGRLWPRSLAKEEASFMVGWRLA